MRFRHALVVGGSGMLGDLCRSLLWCSDTVSVMARNEARIHAIAPTIVPAVCDYNDAAALEAAWESVSAVGGQPDLIVAWIHGRVPELRRRFASGITRGGRFVQLLGSAHGDPARPERLAEMKAIADGPTLLHQAVVLGFVVENGRSRWLADREISHGVFQAIESAAPLTIVGTVEPWSARP